MELKHKTFYFCFYTQDKAVYYEQVDIKYIGEIKEIKNKKKILTL